MGTCEWYHAYSSSAKAKMPCCETEGFIAEIVGEDSYNDIKRPCPGLMPLYAYYADNQGDNFYSTLDDEIAWVVTTNDDYKGLSNGIVCWAWSHENSTNTLTNTLKNATLPKCDSTGRDLEATSKKPVELNIVGIVRSPKPDEDIPPIVCGPKAEVKMTDGNQGCVCSAGYIGNATDMINGCIPIVACNALSCGPNAVCKVENNTILCQCKLGTSGNPFDMKDGCRTFVVTASMWGDPHYTTFDGQKFDWHGICPYIYSMNCKPGNIAPYEDFKVKARNTNIWADEKGIKRRIGVSRVVEVEVEFPDVVIHVDANYKLYVDGQPQPYDYYFPNASFNKINVVNQPGVVTITRNDGIVIVLKDMYLGITIPDVPQLQGADKICGLSGNRDKNCQNDLKMRNGTVVPTNEVCKTIVGYAPAIQAGDSWLIPKTEFLNTPGAELETCIAGKLKSDVGSATCEGDKLGRSLELCQPILDAKNGKGVFSACQPLGNHIYKMHESCGFDVCLLPTVKCQSFATFAQKCQAEVPCVEKVLPLVSPSGKTSEAGRCYHIQHIANPAPSSP
uniref:VWFD domain-containing protein n=1 Tax=Acrobeloides nanus TaxID=290746 RepID=A0A914E2E6_9BILA